jgi:serine/threonine-protein kinase
VVAGTAIAFAMAGIAVAGGMMLRRRHHHDPEPPLATPALVAPGASSSASPAVAPSSSVSEAPPTPASPTPSAPPRRRADGRPPRVAAAPAEKSAGAGTLAFRIRPWAEIFVDGKSLGVSPLAPVDLPAGRHHVLLRNTDLGKERSLTANVTRGETTTLRVDLLE